MAADESESDFDIDIDADDLIPGFEDSPSSVKASKLMVAVSSEGSSSEEVAPRGLLVAAAAAASHTVSEEADGIKPVASDRSLVPLPAPATAPVESLDAKTLEVARPASADEVPESAGAPEPRVVEVARPASAQRDEVPESAGAPEPRVVEVARPASAQRDEVARPASAQRDEVPESAGAPEPRVVEVARPTSAQRDEVPESAGAPEPRVVEVGGGSRAAPQIDEVLERLDDPWIVEVGRSRPTAAQLDEVLERLEGPDPWILEVGRSRPTQLDKASRPKEAMRCGCCTRDQQGRSACSTVAASNETSRETQQAVTSPEEWDDIAMQNEPQEAEEDLEREWEEIGRKTEELAKNAREQQGVVAAKQDLLSTPISQREVTQWILQLQVDPEALRELRETMEEDDLGCGCFKRRRPMSDVPGLDKKLWAEKDLVLFLKVTHFDFNNTTHHRMLRSIYTKLARNKVCPSVGRHWEVLGFQGGDPRTDLNRSGGVLNVLQLFHFFSHHFELLKAAYLLAQDTEQNFPLACVSINITKMTIEALLAGKLSKLCNSGSKGVFEMTCRIHGAALYHFYWRWRTQKRSIQHTEVTFNEVRALLFRRPKKLLEMLELGLEESRARSDPNRLQFTELDFGAARPKAMATNSLPARLWQYECRE